MKQIDVLECNNCAAILSAVDLSEDFQKLEYSHSSTCIWADGVTSINPYSFPELSRSSSKLSVEISMSQMLQVTQIQELDDTLQAYEVPFQFLDICY